MTIEDWRVEINTLDGELLRLLNKRARLALQVGESKTASGLSLCDRTREREVLERMCEQNQGPLDERAIVELFRAVIHESRRIQSRTLEEFREKGKGAEIQTEEGRLSRVAFQGAPGAFSEEAAVSLLGDDITLCLVLLSSRSSAPSVRKLPTMSSRLSRTARRFRTCLFRPASG